MTVFVDFNAQYYCTVLQVAAFILEPFFVIAGVLAPPPGYLESVCRLVRSHGGLVIADEVQTGLGRTGEMWGFMNTAAVPDIVTVGKPLGNGHPMGAVVCSREISERLGGYFSTFGGNPVSCAIGLTVLEVSQTSATSHQSPICC